MDARQPHPFTRPPDRPLMHNPNHSSGPPPPPPPPTFKNYPPVTTQPFHPPTYAQDPYPTARRDPFFPPSSHHNRQASYGVVGPEGPLQPNDGRQGGWGNTARHHPPAHMLHQQQHHPNGPPPPPPPSMTSPHHPSSQSPYAPDASRRRSLGGITPPNPYGAPSHEHPPPPPPPPPPSFSRNNMPPPLSPQQQQHHSSQAQRAPYSTAFGGRELPGINQVHRPGSSMSISSIIGGGDAGPPAQTSQSQSSPHMNAPPSNSHHMQPPSPRRGPPSISRPDFQSFRRQPSPDRHLYSGGPRTQEAHNYNAPSPRSYGPQGSPDQGRPSQGQASQPYKPMVFQGQRSYAASPNDSHPRDSRIPPAAVPPRPNSQPLGPGQANLDHTTYDSPNMARAQYGPPEERRRTLGDSHHTRPNVAELVGGASQASDRDRPSTVQPVSHSTFSPPRDPRSALEPNASSRNPWRHTVPEEPLREASDTRRDERPPTYRPFGGYSAPPQGPSPYGPLGPEDMVRGRSLDHLNHRVTEQYHAAPTSDPNSTERHKSEQLSRSLSSGSYAGRSIYGPDANRRTGRASPLPQAVQGAQGQPLSVGKDPHVKSEFGRMFSGLGGLGSSTPSRGSPMPQNAHDALPGTDLTEHLRLQRVSSQNGRKPKRVKDEEASFDQDDMDGRGTPVGMRGAKRTKSTHPGHHHHHHAHHHHHHHHKPDEEMPPTYNPAFPGRQTNTPSNGTGQSHHHHHYHSGPHHHHHPPRPNQPSLPSPKIAAKVHDVQAVLDEAAKHPRRHLGSQLYEASTELPKPNSSVDDQFGYASKPKQLPRFDSDPVNCTFTIRVPRFYLKPRQRQQIVLQRHLWGAQIFRDNSDPIAAAIHSGWIRGEWDDTVNVGLLDPRITAPNAPSDAEDTLSKAPTAPVTPPADMDLQIDVLILPRIQEYASTVEYGISSRKSTTHDGLSFMIHKMRWVEEGIGSRGQERTAAAMKRRLDASAALLSLLGSGDESLRAVTKLHA